MLTVNKKLSVNNNILDYLVYLMTAISLAGMLFFILYL